MKKIIYRVSKRIIDIVLSSAGLVILLPVFAVIALVIKLQSPGSVILKRKCVKRGGFYFMYKFRSMFADADNLEKYLTREQIDEYHRNIKVINDPRITTVGRFLRKTSLDELPQLFNVLKGEMSLVGVRPLAEEETHLYGRELDKMLSVKPGITGYWQTHGRSSATYENGKRKELELYYVHNQSFLLDISILIKTLVILVTGGGGAM